MAVDGSPFAALGLTQHALRALTPAAAKEASDKSARVLQTLHHPDVGGDEKRFKAVSDAASEIARSDREFRQLLKRYVRVSAADTEVEQAVERADKASRRTELASLRLTRQLLETLVLPSPAQLAFEARMLDLHTLGNTKNPAGRLYDSFLRDREDVIDRRAEGRAPDRRVLADIASVERVVERSLVIQQGTLLINGTLAPDLALVGFLHLTDPAAVQKIARHWDGKEPLDARFLALSKLAAPTSTLLLWYGLGERDFARVSCRLSAVPQSSAKEVGFVVVNDMRRSDTQSLAILGMVEGGIHNAAS